MPLGSKRIFITPLTAVETTDKEGVGTIRWEGSNCFKWVQYDTAAGAVAAVAGNVCYYLGGATPVGYANSIVTSDLSESVGIGAGVLQSAPADNEFCWIQIRGKATVTTALTAGADGNALTVVGSTDGTLDVSALVTDHICAVAEDISLKKIICLFPF